MSETRELLLHPIRLRIVQTLVGAPMTPLQLKERLGDVPQATLYRHLNLLAESGLLEVVDERPVRGTVERTYAVATAKVALTGDQLESATPEDHVRYFATFLGTLLSDFAAYIDHAAPDLAEDRVGYRQVPLWLTDDELDALVERMRGAVLEHVDNAPGPGRRRRLLSTIVVRDDRG